MLQQIDLCTLRLSKSILKELWIFFACIYTKKICLATTTVTWKIICHWLLAPPMSLQYSLKHLPCSTECVDVYYKHICGNIMEPFIHAELAPACAAQNPC